MKSYFKALVLFLIFQVGVGLGQDIPKKLYVLNGLGQSVSKMNLETGNIVNDFITVGEIPNKILAWGEKIYLVNSVPPGITIIDPFTDEVTNIPMAANSNPWEIEFVGTNRAYVTNLMTNTVSVIDLETGTVEKDIPVGTGPEGIIVDGNKAYVTNTGGYPTYDGSSVTIIDITTDTVLKTLDVATNPQSLAIAPDGNIHVMCTGNFVDAFGKVCVISPWGAADYTPAVVDTIEIGGAPGDIVITSTGIGYLCDWGNGTNGYLYAYNIFTGEVLNDSTDPILVGNGAMNLLFDPIDQVLWVSNFADDAVQKLDPETGEVLEIYAFGDGAQDMAVIGPIKMVDPWADEVVGFNPGVGAGFGQNYFPNNVLGPPDPNPSLSEYLASNDPREILALGHGGEIILKFTDNYIVDGDGVDFTIFENVFLMYGTDEPFIEAAIVSVSADGENWVTFPYDTATYAGLAGVTPMYDNQNPTNPLVSGGDSFDLSDVGLDLAVYVKLTDLGDIKQEGAFNDHFDLDAIVAINSEEGQPSAVETQERNIISDFELFQNYPNPFNPETTIRYSLPATGYVEIVVFNFLGQKVKSLVNAVQQGGAHQIQWNGTDENGQMVSSGIYYYQLKSGNEDVVKKMILLH